MGPTASLATFSDARSLLQQWQPSANLMAAAPLSLGSYLGNGLGRPNPPQSGLLRMTVRKKIDHELEKKKKPWRKLVVLAAPEESSKSDETVPSWARPNSDEPPPWARDESKPANSQPGFEIPFFVYLLASAVTAIAAIGSVFEYVNQRPVFGVLNSDSIFYAPLLGFFAFTGVPTSAFLWFKSVEVANKEAEEQDKRDGYL